MFIINYKYEKMGKRRREYVILELKGSPTIKNKTKLKIRTYETL